MQQFWIADTIMAITEKSCFLSLIFWMQPLNQITYHKVATSIENIATAIENITTASMTGVYLGMGYPWCEST